MGLSKLSAKCRKCPHKDNCDHKKMEALAYVEPMAAEASMPLTQPIASPILRETITIHTGKNHLGDVVVYKDEIEKELNKHLYEHLYKDIYKSGA